MKKLKQKIETVVAPNDVLDMSRITGGCSSLNLPCYRLEMACGTDSCQNFGCSDLHACPSNQVCTGAVPHCPSDGVACPTAHCPGLVLCNPYSPCFHDRPCFAF